MGTRVKTFDSTGTSPNGRLFAGDLNLLQDQYADQANFAQTIDISTLRVGDSSLQLLKYGTGEFRLSGAVRTDGLLRGLGGIIAGAFTTTARDAIALSVGLAPYGTIILNTTTNQYEWNKGNDATRNWIPLGVDPVGSIVLTGAASALSFTALGAGNYFLSARRSGDSFDRFRIREDGRLEWGSGAATPDTFLYRGAVGWLYLDSKLRLIGDTIELSSGVASILGDGSNVKARSTAGLLVQNGDGSITFATIGNDTIAFKTASPQRYAVRSAQGSKRRIESGFFVASYGGFSTAMGGSVTYVTPFASTPAFVAVEDAQNTGNFIGGVSSETTTGAGVFSYSSGSPGYTRGFRFIAEGVDV